MSNNREIIKTRQELINDLKIEYPEEIFDYLDDIDIIYMKGEEELSERNAKRNGWPFLEWITRDRFDIDFQIAKGVFKVWKKDMMSRGEIDPREI